jgi:RHS repeat-associated protein
VEYFRQQLSVTNTSAVWDSVTVSATGQTSVTGHVFVPKNPESYTYDADGNLLTDGRWTYAWDGENRLVGLTSLSGAPSASLLQLAFTYDYMGRRIQKIVFTNISGSYVGEYTNKYAYDGWNCLAILNPSLSLSNSFLWGSDLSGSLQGAGGVGGLIKVSYYGTTTTNCFVAFDGNGNVSALINASNGVTVANYDYGPFGEVLRMSGPMAKLNPKRFQTVTDDDETDLLYYGYRYYNPSTGRFIKRDPAEEEGASLLRTGRQSDDQFDANGNWIGETNSVNLYAFVANDPVDSSDYLGMVRIVKDARGFTIVYVDPNEIVWWMYHSNKRNPVFLPPIKANGAAGDLGCYAAYQNQRIAKHAGFLIPGSPTAMAYPWDSKVNPITDQTEYAPAVSAMGQGTVQLVNSWLSAGGAGSSCALTTVTVTIVDASGFWGGWSPPKIKSYKFTQPIHSFSPYTGGQ